MGKGLETIFLGLTQALSDASASTRSPAFERAREAMARRAPGALGALVRRGARELSHRSIADMTARIFRSGQSPPADLLALLLKYAEANYAAERARGRAGHWSHDFNRTLSLAEAIVTLRHWLRRKSG